MVATASFEREGIPLLCIGEKSGHGGAAVVDVGNAKWKSEAILLMRAAHIIIITPGTSRGFLWELKTIVRQDVVRKCVFVLPPSTLQSLSRPESEYNQRAFQMWRTFIEAAASHGLELLDYHPEGLIFHVVPGRPDRVRSIQSHLIPPILKSGRLAKAVLTVVGEPPQAQSVGRRTTIHSQLTK